MVSVNKVASKNNNTRSRTFWLLAVSTVLTVAGCSGEEQPFRKETSGLTGQVFVDGVPVPAKSPLKVECHNVNGIDKEHPTLSSALTGVDGKFEISTYESGDGVPAGDYVITFEWGKMNLIAGSYDGPDKLGGKYSDSKTSKFKITVTPGEPADLGKIELVSAEAEKKE